MIEEVTRKDTINKDTVHKMLKNNKAYLKGLEAERRELIQQLSDCQKQLADLELFADIQNEISISPTGLCGLQSRNTITLFSSIFRSKSSKSTV